MNKASDFWEEVGFELFVIFCWMFLGGLLLGVIALLLEDSPARTGCVAFAAVLIVPAIIHSTLLTIWHWKSRYQGKHSKLWGALLILETSGWFRLIYLLRHVVPDRRNTGRYRQLASVQSTAPSLDVSS
jgi:hypothetical protein